MNCLDQNEQADPQSAIYCFQDEFKGIALPPGWVVLKTVRDENCSLYPRTQGLETVHGIQIVSECIAPRDVPEGFHPGNGFILTKILGITISGLAAAQGKPFWFDVLKKLFNVRSAGNNPVENEMRGKKS